MTTNHKHTPGPWYRHCYRVVSGTTSVADCKPDNGEGIPAVRLPDEALANAHLIAAAPGLLAALELALATIHRLSPPVPYDSTQGTRDVIAAAIAKATGQN